MPVHTPGAIGSAGNDDQGPALDNTGIKYPNSVDGLAGMQYPDMPGGPDVNAPRSPYAQAHPPAVVHVTDPTYAPANGLVQYGTIKEQMYSTGPGASHDYPTGS